MTNPSNVAPPPLMSIEFALGCVAPLIESGSVMAGSADARLIVGTPTPTMLNEIESSPMLALASVIAWRRVPTPASALLVTVKAVSSNRGSKFSSANDAVRMDLYRPPGARHVFIKLDPILLPHPNAHGAVRQSPNIE